MKKKIVSVMLCSAMAASMLAGCGAAAPAAPAAEAPAAEAPAAEAPAAEAPAAEVAEAPAGDEGSVLNIQCWNEEFKSRVTDHYPGYEEVDATTGKIGDVTVNWTITPSDDNAYQNNLDTILPGNADAAADAKVDIFLMEADYALKYVNAPVTMNMTDLGITDADFADQYQYTKDIVTDASGNLKGASWQACSAGLIYNREAAKEIIGSDDPADVQAAVATWADYKATAEKAAAAGYTMCSVNDTYRVYSNNVTSPWVADGKLVIDDNIMAWVNDSKELVDNKGENNFELWGDDWGKGKYADGKVFCYFGPAWFFNFCLAEDDEKSIAANGGWGFVDGPQSFYWGGTWIAAATGTDNPTLVKDIILTMTTDKAVLKDIATADSDCVNSKSVLAELASSEEGNLNCLGGQNPYEVLAAGAEKVDMSNVSGYDQGCNEEFQNAMKNYFNGNAATVDDALALFKTAISEKYPELDVQ